MIFVYCNLFVVGSKRKEYTMKKILAAAVMVILMTPLSAHAFDWTSLFRWLFVNTETTSKTKTVNEYTTVAANIKNSTKSVDENLEKTLLKVISNLSTQKEAETFEKRINEISTGNKTESEKTTQLIQTINDYASALQSNKIAVIVTIKALSNDNKKELTNSIDSLSKCVQQYTELEKKAYNSANELQKYTATGDEQTKVLNEINNINTELKNKANALQTLTTTLKLFNKLGGLEI